MQEKLLHITNGDFLTEKLAKTKIDGDVIVWREMLSQGPTVPEVGSDDFFKIRSTFLADNYNIPKEKYAKDFVKEIEKLSTINNYEGIVLWFEFDLFCHLNMLAAISFLIQNRKKEPVYLVCSSRLKGEKETKHLSKLSPKELKKHYDHKIKLTRDDLNLAHHIWQLYSGNNHERLSAELKKTSNFEYLSSCIKAHLERFPHATSGLNTMETNILRLITEHEIISQHHLLGYALEYQGYYGYMAPQMTKTLDKLKPFFSQKDDKVVLNDKGKQALEDHNNFYRELKDEEFFGGAKKYDFLYNPNSHDLLKL